MENLTLSIFCTDTIAVEARMTFSEFLVPGLKITYWFEEAEDYQQRIDSIFDIIFDEVFKTKILGKS